MSLSCNRTSCASVLGDLPTFKSAARLKKASFCCDGDEHKVIFNTNLGHRANIINKIPKSVSYLSSTKQILKAFSPDNVGGMRVAPIFQYDLSGTNVSKDALLAIYHGKVTPSKVLHETSILRGDPCYSKDVRNISFVQSK